MFHLEHLNLGCIADYAEFKRQVLIPRLSFDAGLFRRAYVYECFYLGIYRVLPELIYGTLS